MIRKVYSFYSTLVNAVLFIYFYIMPHLLNSSIHLNQQPQSKYKYYEFQCPPISVSYLCYFSQLNFLSSMLIYLLFMYNFPFKKYIISYFEFEPSITQGPCLNVLVGIIEEKAVPINRCITCIKSHLGGAGQRLALIICPESTVQNSVLHL